MKYLPPLFLLLAGCVTEPHSGQDCADQGSTNANFGIIGLAASIHCYGTAKDSGASESQLKNESDQESISSSQQLLELIADSTYAGRSENGMLFVVYSRQDGRMIGRTENGDVDEGTWEVTTDKEYCRQWNSWRNATRACFLVYKVDDQTLRFKGIGQAFESVGRIVPGDPEHLERNMSTANVAKPPANTTQDCSRNNASWECYADDEGLRKVRELCAQGVTSYCYFQ